MRATKTWTRSRRLVAAAVLVVAAAAPAQVGQARVGPALGASQSPIDFRADDITFVDRLPRIRFEYPRHVDVTLVNTGSPNEEATVRADVPAGAAYVMQRGVRYDLLQFHWHTPAEHTVEGVREPLEMHLVHRRDDGSLLVIGVLIEEGDRNRPIAPIFANLSRVTRWNRGRGGRSDREAPPRRA